MFSISAEEIANLNSHSVEVGVSPGSNILKLLHLEQVLVVGSYCVIFRFCTIQYETFSEIACTSVSLVAGETGPIS